MSSILEVWNSTAKAIKDVQDKVHPSVHGKLSRDTARVFFDNNSNFNAFMYYQNCGYRGKKNELAVDTQCEYCPTSTMDKLWHMENVHSDIDEGA